MLARLPAGELAEPGELGKLSFGGNAKALCTAPCVEYGDALAEYAALCSEYKEYRDHGMLRVLLELYGERYGRGKRARSALDFEDLELLTRDLLGRARGPAPAVRASASRTCSWTSSRTPTRSRTS